MHATISFRRRSWEGCWPPLVVTLLVLLAAGALAADELGEDQRFVAGLRERRLFGLAEDYCREQLQSPQLDAARRAQLTIELVRALAAKAIELPPAKSASTWQQALEVVADFARQYPDNPRLPLVELQGALVQLARGELLRDQLEFAAGGDERYRPALAELQGAIAKLAELRRRNELQLRDAPLSSKDDQQLTAAELAATGDHLDRQLARAYRRQAGCFASGTPDAVDSLNQAVELLRQLSQRETTDELRWECRLELAACWRQLGEPALAQQALDELDATQPPPQIALCSRAERVRLALAAGKPPAALELLTTGRKIEGQVSPELDTAFLEVYLAVAADLLRQQRAAEAEQYQRRADAVLIEIERAHGPYWARRAELAASRGAQEAGPGAGVELLVHTAERLHAAGQADDSLTAYDRAAEQCRAAGDEQRAFELAFVAATIEHQRQNFAAARDRYRQAAQQFPAAPRAAEAHLLAAYDALEAAKLIEPLDTADYRALLVEHLRLWPSGELAGEARWRLARLETLDRHWQQALEAYRAIEPTDPRFVDSIRAAADVYTRWFAEQQAAGDDPSQQAAAAAGEFEALARPARGDSLQQQEARRAAAWAATRLWIDSGRANFARAEQLGRMVLSDPQATPHWRQQLLPLLVVALAGQGKTAEAEQHLQEMANANPRDLLAVLEPLVATAAAGGAELARELAPLELRTLDLLRGRAGELPADEKLRLRRLEARALAGAGQREQAQAAYDALLKSTPRDGALREEVAAFLSAADDGPSRVAALAAWRDLERQTKPGTPRWFRAKYEIALAHHQAGDDAQSAKIIALTRVLHPELGGPELRAKFTRLEQQLQRQRPPR